jgi:toxin CptA
MTSAPAIGFEYRPSRWLGHLLRIVGFLAGVAALLSGLPWPIRLAMGVAVLLAVRHALAHQAVRSIEAAGWARDGSWSLRVHSGEDVTAGLASFRVWGEQFVWLRLSLPRKRHAALLLAPDNSDADLRRRLRMRLAQLEAAGHSGG